MPITASTILDTDFGELRVNYHKMDSGFCLSFVMGDVTKGIPIIRIHSSCLFGESFSSRHCDCDEQLEFAMDIIQKGGAGIIIYFYQEGRGAGLENKIKAMEVEREFGIDTIEAYKKIGLRKHDYRDYKCEVEALKELNTSKEIIFFTGSPEKIKALENEGFKIKEFIEFNSQNLSEKARKEIEIKKKKMGYNYRI
jgi:3,4-dihydroxy 2-butanone 4-phosphate synthase/GTP cyclohydrolase II